MQRREKEARKAQATSPRWTGLSCWGFAHLPPLTSRLSLLAQGRGQFEPSLTFLPFHGTGELAGLRQQMIAIEQKVALDKELLAQKLVQAEREAQASLREQQVAHEEDLQRLQREKVWAAGWEREAPL